VAAATECGIVVLNTPDANATTTAELALTHLLSLSRHLPQADRSARAGERQPAKFGGTELSGKSVGVIGFGTIGRIFARQYLALKMQVLAYDPFVTPEIIEETSAELVTLDALLARADYVSLHCPLTDQTRNLIDAVRLAQMKPGACLINCARGALVDEATLCHALQSDHLAGAALDVYAHEPPKGSPLLSLDTVVLTPHLGASTKEARPAVSVKIAEDMTAFLTTGEAPSAVNLPRISAEQLVRTRPYQHLAHALGGFIAAMARMSLVRCLSQEGQRVEHAAMASAVLGNDLLTLFSGEMSVHICSGGRSKFIRLRRASRKLAGRKGRLIMRTWTPDERLTFDIAFALKKVTIPGFRKALTEEHRISIAKAVIEHLKLCRWEFSKPPEAVQ
jgi:D-3-phosphoglycerate dehydrogenase